MIVNFTKRTMPDHGELFREMCTTIHMRKDSLKDSACVFDYVADGHQFTMTLKELKKLSDALLNAEFAALKKEYARISLLGLSLDECEYGGDEQRVVDGKIINNIGIFSFNDTLMKSVIPIPGLFYAHDWHNDCYLAYNSAISNEAIRCNDDDEILAYLLHGIRPK